MSTLIIDTATDAVIVGIISEGELCAERIIPTTREHVEKLAPLIAELVPGIGNKNNPVIDRIIAGIGPGAFTGLRVGLNTARALAHALDVPVYPACSLDAMAHAAFRLGKLNTGAEAVAIMDARRKEWFWASYDKYDEHSCSHYKVLAVGPPQEVPQAEVIIAPAALGVATIIVDHPSALDYYYVAQHTSGNPHELKPLYVRAPDAAPPTSGPKKVVPAPKNSTRVNHTVEVTPISLDEIP